MIRAYILIETNGGQSYKYVRDVTTDSNGVGGSFYRYEGNGYQNFNIASISELKASPLQHDVLYSVNINVDGAGATEYTFSFPSPSNQIGIINTRSNGILWETLLEKLNQLGKNDWFAKIVDKDIRIISNGTGAGTSIAITAGLTGTDLLATLGSTPSAAVPGEAYDDLSGAGTVKGDYGTIVTSWTGAAGLLSFPESTGATPIVRRKNTNNGADDYTSTFYQILNTNVSSIKVVEEIEEEGVYKP